jgi:Flp pilus assembly protein TadG
MKIGHTIRVEGAGRHKKIHHSKNASRRNQGGVLGYVMLSMLILGVIGIGAYACDISHNVSVRAQLQNATDAAALAGAKDLVIPNQEGMTEADAEAVAEANLADGEPVSTATPNTEVEVQSLPTATGGECQVTAHKQINNYFARIFGHNTDPVDVTSTAIAYRSVTSVRPNSLFPMVVSIDTLNGHTVPLYQSQIGDSVSFYLESQQYKNCAWTGFNTGNVNSNYVNDAIDQMLGFAPVESGFIPSVDVGDSLALMNGVASTKDLTEEPYFSAITDGRTLYVPVVSGEPPYNQERPCMGYIGIKVTNVIKNQQGGKVLELVCTLVKGFVKGTPGEIASSNNNQINTGIENLSAGIVQLSH